MTAHVLGGGGWGEDVGRGVTVADVDFASTAGLDLEGKFQWKVIRWYSVVWFTWGNMLRIEFTSVPLSSIPHSYRSRIS